MKRFFNWLFGTKKADSSKFVKNMKADSYSDSGLDNSFGKVVKMKSGETLLAWIQTANIKENIEDNKGTTIDLILKEGTKFTVINTIDKIKVDSKKKGLTEVEHTLAFKAQAEDRLKILESAKNQKISFMKRTPDGSFVFLGEENGLNIVETDDDLLLFRGTESDIFFRVTEECFYKLLPNIEK